MENNESKQSLFDDVKYLLTGQISEQVQQLLTNSNAKLQKYTSGMITHCIAGTDADAGVCEEVKDIFEKPVVTASWVSLSAYCNKLLPAALFDPAAGLFARYTFSISRVSRADFHILWALITVNGGKVKPVLDVTCTHLICGKAVGKKYEQASRFLDLRVVTPDWIVHCITQKCQIAHEAYHPSLLIEQSVSSQAPAPGPAPVSCAPSPVKQGTKVERPELEKVEQEAVPPAPLARTGEPPIITASNSKIKVASNLPPHLEQQIQQHSMAKSNLQSIGSPAGRPGRIARSASGPQTTWRPTAQPRQPLEQQAIIQRSLSQPTPAATPQQQQQQVQVQPGGQVRVATVQQTSQARPVQHLITLQGTGNRPTALIMQQQVRQAGNQEDLLHHVRLQQPNRPQLVTTRLPMPAANQEAQKLQSPAQVNKVPQQTAASQQQQQVEQKSSENTEETQSQQNSTLSSNQPNVSQQQPLPTLPQQQVQVQQQGVQKQQEQQVVQQQSAGNQQQPFLATPQQIRARFMQPGQQQQVQFTQRVYIQQQPGQHIQQLQVVQKQNFINMQQQQQVQMQQQMTQAQLQHLQQQQQQQNINQVDGQGNHILQSHPQGPQQGQQANQQIMLQNQQHVQQPQLQQQTPVANMQQQGIPQVQNQSQQVFQQQPSNQIQQKPQIVQQVQQQQQQQVLLNFHQGQPQQQTAQQAAHQQLQQPNVPQVQQVQRPPQPQGMQQVQQHLLQQQMQQRQIQLQQQQQQMQQAQFVQQRQVAPQQQVMPQQQVGQQIGPNQSVLKSGEMQQQQHGGGNSQVQQQQLGANTQQQVVVNQGQQQVLLGVTQQQMNVGGQEQPRQFLPSQQNQMQQGFVAGQAVQQPANPGVVTAGQQQPVRQPMPQFMEQGQQIMRPGMPQQVRPFTLQQQQQLQLHLQRLDPQSRQQLQQMNPQARTMVLQRILQQHELQMQSKQRMMLQQQPLQQQQQQPLQQQQQQPLQQQQQHPLQQQQQQPLQQQQQQPGETNVVPQQHMVMQRPPIPQQVVVRNVIPFPQQQQQQQVQQQAGQAVQQITPAVPQQQQDAPIQEQQPAQPPPAAQQHPAPAAPNPNEQQSTMVNQVNPKTKTALANLLNTRLQGSPASQVPQQQQPQQPQQQQQPQPQQQQPMQQVHLPQQANVPHAMNPQQQQQILAQQQQQRRGLLNITNGPPQSAAQVPVPAGAAASPAVIQQHQPKLAIRMPGPVNAPAVIRRELPVQQLFGHEPGVRLPEKFYFLGCVFLIHEYSRSVPVAEIQSWVKIIQNSGGEVEPAYSPRITHIICENTRSPVVQQAMREGKRLVTAYWLNDVVVKGQMVPPWQVLHFPTPFGEADRPCKNLRASISGFEGDDRARVKFMCDSIGLKYTGHFSRQHDLLICRKPEGPKYQKAREWRKPVVTVQWLAELHFGFLLALQQMHHPKYQQFFAPHYVQDPFRFEMVMATALLVAWRMPIRLTQEIVEKAKPLAEMKAKRRLSAASANNDGQGTIAGSESPSKKKSRLEGDDKDKPEKNSSNLDAILDDVAKGGFDADGKPRPAVRFSGLEQCEIIELSRLMVPLGLSMATSNKESTHLVMPKLQRTPKFLSCLPFVRFVVSSKWIRDSAEQGKLIDEAGYLLEDGDYEKKFNFSLRALLESPNRDQLFRGKTFYVTPSVLPARSVLIDMIESSGGKVAAQRKSVKSIVEMNQLEENSYLVISCEADLHLVSDLARAKISIYNTEFVMNAVVTQKIPFKSCTILPSS